MYSLPLFERWRHWWDCAEVLHKLVVKADDVAKRRNALGDCYADIEWSKYQIWLRHQFANLIAKRPCEVLDNPNDCDPTYYEHRVAECLLGLERPLRASYWPRWKQLEKSFELASASGDLLLSGLVLRTQIEELDLYAQIDLLLDLTKRVENKEALAADLRSNFHRLSTVVDSTLLFRCEAPTHEQLTQPTNRGIRIEELKETYHELGDYVHPNYGSHLLFVRPQSVLAGQIISNAFIAVNEFFLNWCGPTQSEQSPSFAVVERANRPVQVIVEAIPSFVSRCENPELKRSLLLAEESLKHFCELENAAEDTAQQIPVTATMEQRQELNKLLAPLADALEPTQAPHELESIFCDVSTIDWPVPLHTNDARMRWGLFVSRSAEALESKAAEFLLNPSLATEMEYARWFDLISDAIMLTVCVTDLKIKILAEHAASLLLQENVLGSALCIRSILEHHAVIIESTRNFLQEWDAAHDAARNQKDAAPKILDLEKHVARFLVGTKNTREIPTSWKKRWDDKPRLFHVMKAIDKTALELPYGLLSKIVHGEVYRGGDLLGSGARQVTHGLILRLTSFLGSLLDIELQKDRTFSAMAVAYKLAHTAARQARTTEELVQIFALERMPDKFVRGRDIRGEGTESTPYRFRHGLLYPEVIYAFCYKENLEFQSQDLWYEQKVLGDIINTTGGRRIYFCDAPFDPKQSTRTSHA
jgi:hypothetical protein